MIDDLSSEWIGVSDFCVVVMVGVLISNCRQP